MPETTVHTITRRAIPEVAVEGRPLGRHVNHDSRSLNYLVAPDGTVATARWNRVIPVLDQGQVGSCHDSDTDILTSTGWLPFADLTFHHKVATVNPVTREMAYEHPTRVVRMKYTGNMHTVSNMRHDFSVTPDHTMLVRKWDEGARTLKPNFEFVPMKDLDWYTGLMETVVFNGTTPHDGTYRIPGIPGYKRATQRDDLVVPMRSWLKFLGVYLAEGTILNNVGSKIQIAAVNIHEKVFVRQVLAELGVPPLELKDRFTFYSARIWRHLEALGLKGVYASEKFVPDFVFDLSAADIDAFLEGHREVDGSQGGGRWTHHTSSPRLSEDLQRLIFLAGGRIGVSVRAPRTSTMSDGRIVVGRSPEHGVRHLKGSRSWIERQKDVRFTYYDGLVYCAEVPSHHTLVTRRGGKVLISGNCTGNAATGALGTEPDYDSLKAQLEQGLQLNEAEALKLYSAAENIDGDGPYPPNDHGSSGLSVAKAAQNAGLISGYTHITSIAAAQTAIQAGPFIVGTDWYTSFDTPDSNGVVAIAKGATVRGGHEYECIGYDAKTDLWEMVNSWGTTFGVDGHFFYSTATFKALLANQGDATVLIPLSAPAPTPTPPPAPTPPATVTVVVDDAALVAHIQALAARQGLSPHDYLAKRLEGLWHLSG